MGDIVLPAGIKMRVLYDALGAVSWLDFAVLFALYHEVDRATGITQISHGDLAQKIGCKTRAAQNSTARLVNRGFIQVERKRLGERRDGSLVYGGVSGKNRYRLIFERTHPGALSNDERASPGALIKERTPVPERAHAGTGKSARRCITPYTLVESHKNPLRAGARAEAHNPSWSKVRSSLAIRLGVDVFNAWFANVSLAKIVGDTVTLHAPTKFISSQIDERYGGDLLACWQAELAYVLRVVIAYLADRAPQAEAGDAK